MPRPPQPPSPHPPSSLGTRGVRPPAPLQIITTGFKAIHLIYFFTAGADEVKCWQIRRQSKAPQAAGTIHTDFERGFICAEVMKFDELKEIGTENGVKAAGAARSCSSHWQITRVRWFVPVGRVRSWDRVSIFLWCVYAGTGTTSRRPRPRPRPQASTDKKAKTTRWRTATSSTSSGLGREEAAQRCGGGGARGRGGRGEAGCFCE